MSTEDRNERFISRWSRRKIESNELDQKEGSAEAAPLAVADGEGVADEQATAPIPPELPDVDSLDADSDYTVFMQEGVPEEIRTLALRKLWQSDPVLANLDGLNDYDDDFGSILRTGAEYIQKLVDAGDKLTRPGEDPPEPADAGETEEFVSEGGGKEDDKEIEAAEELAEKRITNGGIIGDQEDSKG